MDSTSYEKAKNLLYKIDDLSTSADNVIALLNEIKSDRSTARFVVNGEKGTSTTELTKETSEKICKVILENYHDLIQKSKKELNMIIDKRLI